MQIFVKFVECGETISLEVEAASDTVSNVKAEILRREARQIRLVNIAKLRLSFAGTPLEDSCTLSTYKIVQGSTVECFGVGCVWVTVGLWSRHGPVEVSLKVDTNHSVGSVKRAIQNMAVCRGVNMDAARLYFCGLAMEDHRRLRTYGVGALRQLQLVQFPNPIPSERRSRSRSRSCSVSTITLYPARP